ncbi:MAG: preprotein translocase subunit SecY [archaeon]
MNLGWYDKLIGVLPEVAAPKQKRLSFKEKIKWTIIVLVLFYVLGLIPLAGLGGNALQQFEFLSTILGASFGSIISLGIGPIVTASIVLQLLNGSGLVKFDLTTHEGKMRFQGTQKIMSIAFIVIEAAIYVGMGGLTPSVGIPVGFLVFQIFLGGLMIMFMDEVVSKWGFGSGISLFIAAGVSQRLFVRALSFLKPEGAEGPTQFIGAIPRLFAALINQEPTTAMLALVPLIATGVVFALAVYAQSMKVEIPLSFGRIRGHGIRWPLNFIYTSNIPVILVAALLANIQLFATLLVNWGRPFLGNPNAGTGFVSWIAVPGGGDGLVGLLIRQGTFVLGAKPYLQAIFYVLLLMGGSVLFSMFWVQTSGLDAKSQARQMMASGLQIPGFRKDQRVLERMLQRYIGPLTVMGALAVGFLAAAADLLGALVSGTGLLLTVMIIYRLYEDIAKQHMMDMNPMMRKFMGA